MSVVIKCFLCGKDKKVKPYVVRNQERVFCSINCRAKFGVPDYVREKISTTNKRKGLKPQIYKNYKLCHWKELSEEAKKRIGLKNRAHLLGKKLSEEHKKNISLGLKKSSGWKGDAVGYNGIHSWIRRRIEKPNTCNKCNKKKKLDLANKSGNYSRNLDDWEYLCRRCHMISDGRLIDGKITCESSQINRLHTQPSKKII